MIKKENSVIYIDNNKLLFYVKNANSVLQLNIPSDVISDLEVIDRDKLNNLIDNFFLTPALKGKEFESVLVFSPNTTFEKEVLDNNTKIQAQEAQRFLDMVPFEDIMSNSYKLNKKTKIIAVNKVLYTILKLAIERNKVHIFLVLPMSILIDTNPELKTKIDLSFIENKIESLKQYSILNLDEIGLGGDVANSMGIKKKDRRLYILLLLMFVLGGILVYLVYTNLLAVPQKPKPKIIIPKTIINEVQEKNSDVQEATESAKISTSSPVLKTTKNIKN